MSRGSGGRARRRQPRGASRVGERYEVAVGPVAHGGHCVARLAEGRVVFVRHAIPGERVVLAITEGTDGDRFWRADAVEVLEQSPDRVTPPCPFAGPDRCGGCDFQHVTLERQRLLKASVVQEQLSRLAGLDLDVRVEPVDGDEHGLRWRTRQQYVVRPDGGRAMRKHRSHELVPIDDCLIARRDALTPDSHGEAGQHVVQTVETSAGLRSFTVAHDGFWQVHPGAPRVLVETVLDLGAPRAGESVLDLYAGVGLFTAFLVDAVGPAGSVVAVEGDPRAAEHARANVPGADVVTGDVAEVLSGRPVEHADLVVLDPPRTGARRPVVEQVAGLAPRAVAYVACDPAALGRDVAIFAEHGFGLSRLRAFDLFPMTSHVECVALLEPREAS